MPSVCLDTNIMIRLFKPSADEQEDKLKLKATYLADKIEEEGTTAVVPAIVLGELLDGVGASERLSFKARMESYFQIPPFDVAAALEYSLLPNASGDGVEGHREKCKVDRMVVATARAANCSVLYSEDDDVHRIGNGRIEVLRLPALPETQLPLPNMEVQIKRKRAAKRPSAAQR